MTPDTWRITPVTPELVGEVVLVQLNESDLIQARVERVKGHTLTVVAFDEQHDVDLADGKHVWKRVA